MSSTNTKESKKKGQELLKNELKKLPSQNGVYKMIDSTGNIIYIGKAKNIKKRVTSYTLNNLSPRIKYMISLVCSLKWEITQTEQDALLLESNLIKEFQPFYNILLKDDKSYPFLKLETDHNFPRIFKYRSKKASIPKDTFGPFASSKDLAENIKTIQTIFKLRTCSDNYFAKTKQPCIYYQIKKCSAPCVGKISQEDYQRDVKEVMSFLNGNTVHLKTYLSQKMTEASNNQNYELAIQFREKIKSLNQIEIKQNIFLKENISADFITILKHNNIYICKIFSFKNGLNYGSISFFPKVIIEASIQEVLEYILMQFYNERKPPALIYTNVPIHEQRQEEVENIKVALFKLHQKKVKISNPKKNQYQEILELLNQNAMEEIIQKEASEKKWQSSFKEIKELFIMNNEIKKIEIYDNSHLYGTFPLGAMVCVNQSGFNKKEYRIFNLKNKTIKTNDDYGILKEVLTRRFSKNNPEFPELVLIDGGKGQMTIAKQVKEELKLDNITFIGIAKGPNRNAGEEILVLENGNILKLEKTNSSLHFLQKLRNEAHRFAIKNVRKHKEKSLMTSKLDNIPAIGKKRKQDLLNYFGSIENIASAGIKEIMKINGISKTTAQKIFDWFH